MHLRRRCGDFVAYLAITATVALVLLVSTTIYSTRTERPELPAIVKELLPAGRCLCDFSTTFTCDSCLSCAANSTGRVKIGDGDGRQYWCFNYTRDGSNYGLDEQQCYAAFPGLFEDINRAVDVRKNRHITERELSSFKLSKGMIRGLINEREVRTLPSSLIFAPVPCS